MRLKPWQAITATVLLTTPILATYWTATSYYVLSLSVTHIGDNDPRHAITYSSTYTVKPHVTPTGSTLSTSTYVMTYNDLKIVSVFMAPGAVANKDLVTRLSYDSGAGYTIYVQPVVYTAPASCPTRFTYSTVTQVRIPTDVTDQVTPVSTATSTNTYGQGATYVTKYLSASAVTTQSAATTDFAYSYYVENCRNPTGTGRDYFGPNGPGGSSGGDSDGGSSGGDSYGYKYGICSALTGCTTLKVWIIVVATIIPSLFLLGFLENFLWFRRLMLGKGGLRCGTVCWILISLWVICITRTHHRRSEEDQRRLRAQWKSFSFGTKWSLWWKWGFRHRYPFELLGDPGIANSAPPAPGAPAMTQPGPYPPQAFDPKAPGATVQSFPVQPAPVYYQVQQPDGSWATQVQYATPAQGQPPQYFQPPPPETSRGPGSPDAAASPVAGAYEMPSPEGQSPSTQVSQPYQPPSSAAQQQAQELPPQDHREAQELPSPQNETSQNTPPPK